MAANVLGGVVVLVWLVLLFARGGWWRAAETDTAAVPDPADWPAVTAVVPARDEAAVIGRAAASLAAQDYPGEFRVIVVDDGSSDGTAEVARAVWPPPALRATSPGGGGSAGGDARAISSSPTGGGGARSATEGASSLAILPAAPLASGWTGKLAAVAQGIAAAGDTPQFLWLTDADIEHAPDTLRTLVARAVADKAVLVSLMARLRTDSAAERALVPAFVWFFMMLFPFRAVNRPGPVAAAAGGVMLVDRAALAKAGGIAAIRDALIDDCALAALMKRQGPIRLFLTRRSVSLRPYPRVADVGAMISRSAYAQLRYSPLLLAGTVAGLALTFALPPLLALFARGWAQAGGVAAWGMMSAAFQPMLRFYRRSPAWGAAVPAIAAVYGWYTLVSAVQYHRGRGGQWKGRVQAAAGAV
ncbi:MAG: glycosyltransferase [Sphingomonadaceae bacterium]|nr:glycosyltransferase [Sphingomonadaceae bacterium]